MFFADHEKLIYQPEGSDRQYDPLVLDRRLTVATNGQLYALVSDYNALPDLMASRHLGPPPTKEQTAEAEVITAKATLTLADVAREVFELPAFPACSAAVCLEHLLHFLRWLEKKAETGDSTPPSPEPSPAASA